MRLLVLLAALVAAPAEADLYRWVDPQSGSIKYSSYPPPWFGDPVKEAAAPAVQVIRYELPGTVPPAPAAPSTPRSTLAGLASALETRLAVILQSLQSTPSRGGDLERAGAAFQQHAEAYRAVSAELDRMDPAGAARRRAAAQQAGILDTLRQGIEAQFSAKPPAQK